jgi:putative oxidoreductase
MPQSIVQPLCALAAPARNALNWAGERVAPLGLRLLIAWEFGETGLAKLQGENWFADIQGDFPWPLYLLPAGLNWFLATWIELIGAAGIAAGLATRFWAFALISVDLIAWYSVHAGYGYNVCDNGFKLPLMYLVLLLPLLLSGAGRWSLDAWLRRRYGDCA